MDRSAGKRSAGPFADPPHPANTIQESPRRRNPAEAFCFLTVCHFSRTAFPFLACLLVSPWVGRLWRWL